MTAAQFNCATNASSCRDYRCDVCYRVDPADAWVYFLRRDGLIKIGATLSLRQRVRQLGGDFLYAVPGYVDREHYLHAHFAEFRAHGEWYSPARELVAFIDAARIAGSDWMEWAA